MKKRFLPIGFLTLLISGMAAFFILSSGVENKVEKQDKIGAQEIAGAKEYLAQIRNNQHTGLLNPKDVVQARQNYQQRQSRQTSGIEWTELGPNNVGGRTRAILFDNRDATAKTVYAGSTSGGIFKSENLGSTWSKVNTGSGTGTLNVTSMVQADDGTIYVGTGEGLSTEKFSGLEDLGYEGGFVGKGVFKSNANDDFTLVPGTEPYVSNDVVEWAYINNMAIDKNNNRIFAATHTGLKYATLPNANDWQSECKYALDSTIINRLMSRDSVAICDSFEIDNGNIVLYGSSGWEETITQNDTSSNETVYHQFVPFESYGNCYDVEVSPEGYIITTFNNKVFVSASGNPSEFVNRSIYPDNEENLRKDVISWTGRLIIYDKEGNVLKDSTHNYSQEFDWHSDYVFEGMETYASYPSSSDAGRIEFAIAPSDGNVVYAMAANNGNPKNSLLNIYLSDDGGQSWRIIAPGGAASLNILGSEYGASSTPYYQGDYDNTLAVSPSNPYRLFAGGVDMWVGNKVTEEGYFSWNKKSVSDPLGTSLGTFDPYYCHMDQHTIVFRPTNSSQFLIGTDGGIYLDQSSGNNMSFQAINKNYNATQFYSVDVSTKQNEFVGGTQDNGTVYVKGTGSNSMAGEDLWRYANLSAAYPEGTDGGSVSFSNFRFDETGAESVPPPVFYSRSMKPQNENLIDRMRRSESLGFDYSLNFLSSGITNSSFITPMVLWESYNNENSRDSVNFVADKNYSAGDTVLVNSHIFLHPFVYFLPNAMNEGDTMRVKDIFSSKLFIATEDEIWMSQEIIHFDLNPSWYAISNSQHAGFEDKPSCIAVSTDGNYVFVGTFTGRLFRISNIALAYNEDLADVNSSNCIIATDELVISENNSQVVTSIAVDPKDPTKVLVTLGNYGNDNYVYYSADALSDEPAFVSVQGNLPTVPVYSSILELDPATDQAFIGTEWGVWSTDDVASGNWSFASENVGEIPVMAIKQQTTFKPSFTRTIIDPVTNQPSYLIWPGTENYGEIYIATHGRGVFRMGKSYVGIQEKPGVQNALQQPLHIYPNPAKGNVTIDVQTASASTVTVKVIDFSGKCVLSHEMGVYPKGQHKIKLNIESLNAGSYIIQVLNGSSTRIGKVIVGN